MRLPILTAMTQKKAMNECHEQVQKCFLRHKFKTFGDILAWWHKASYETQILEAGPQGISKFSTDFLWLISNFGPKTIVNYENLKIKN